MVLEFLPELRDLHPDDGIGGRIVAPAAPIYLHTDLLLVGRNNGIGETFLAKILEQLPKTGRMAEFCTGLHAFQQGPIPFELCGRTFTAGLWFLRHAPVLAAHSLAEQASGYHGLYCSHVLGNAGLTLIDTKKY
jgi:hypothetical protein